VRNRDPRLVRLHEIDPDTPPNQQNVFSISGTLLLSENSDAGWRLGLIGAAGQALEGWDQQSGHSRVVYDQQLRAVMAFEQGQADIERCTAGFSYADGSPEAAAKNHCGRLVRQDDTAGSQRLAEYDLSGTVIESHRYFLDDPQRLIDWPDSLSERDSLLEQDAAITRIRCNAVGVPVEQIDARGNVRSLRHTLAGTLRETRLKLAGSGEHKMLVSEIRYNAFGQIEHQRAGNGVISSATFCPATGRLLNLKTRPPGKALLQDLNYEYDPVGNVLSLEDTAQSIRYSHNQRTASLSRFHYNSLYQLIEASGQQVRNAFAGPALPSFQSPVDPSQLEHYTQTYQYDEAGNLLELKHCADSGCRTERSAAARFSNRSLPFKAGGERPDESEITAGYDANGNLKLLQPGQHLRWDLRNQLRQVDQVVREDGPSDAEFYLYDSSGQRVQKIRRAYTGTLTHTHETRYLPGLEIRKNPEQSLQVISLEAGRCKVQVLVWEEGHPGNLPGNQFRYNFTDHLGSSTLELDDQTALIAQESYYPFGTTSWWAGRDKVEASYKTIRYSGQERDATGLYYYGRRYYLPWRQRWLSADPSGTADGLNLYAMVHGNPVGHVDFQGLITHGEVLGAMGASFLREGIASVVAGFIRYGATQGMTDRAQAASDDPDNPIVDPNANVALTATGALVGAVAGGSMGMGAASNIVSRYSNSRTVQRLGAGIGAVIGAAAGAAAPLYAYLSDPDSLNVIAISIIASVPANLTKETALRVSANIGSKITLPPSAVATSLRTAMYGGLLFTSGVARAQVSPLLRILISAGADALNSANTALINAYLEGKYDSETNQLSTPRLLEVIYGLFIRTAGASLTASLTQGLAPWTSEMADVTAQAGVINMMATPTEARTYFGQYAQRGIAELFRYNDQSFTLDIYTPVNSHYVASLPDSYHPDTPSPTDLPMRKFFV
jgi:RHS repeat-associated protein